MIPAHSVMQNAGNAYIESMTHHAHIDINNMTTVKYIDAVADATALTSKVVTADSETDMSLEIKEPFGRNLTVTSTAAGTLTVVGQDYLGQVMTEDVTCIAGDVDTLKAFKFVTALKVGTVAGTLTLKAGPEYGLPFCGVEIVREVVDGVASSEGVLTAPVSTVATSTTGDVRGTYNPNTSSDGSKNISLTYVTTSELTGGLHGQPQA